MNAGIRQIRVGAEQALAEAFAAAKARLPGVGDVPALRETAFRKFETKGLPTRRVEEWKYTDLRGFMREVKPLAGPADAAAKARAASAGTLIKDARRLVFVDGLFEAGLSDLAGLDNGVTIRPLADVLAKGDAGVLARIGKAMPAPEDPAFALNTAFMGDGAVIEIADGVQLTRPLHLV
jgi:Fe-S cluster assembly protein SufD